jgi:heme-degrading monooxygenase HmoA
MVRIVQLTFKKEHFQDFLEHFETVKEDINKFPGCKGMKLLKVPDKLGIVFTYSEWDSEEDLNNYRNSALFGGIWPKVKKWFDDQPRAWSTEIHFDGFLPNH